MWCFCQGIHLVPFFTFSYERVDEIIWVKTNQLQRIIRTGRTGHWLNHGKEHCLVCWSSTVITCPVYMLILLKSPFSIKFCSLSFCRLVRQVICFSSGGCEGKSSGLQQRFGLWRDRSWGKRLHRPSFFLCLPLSAFASHHSMSSTVSQVRSTSHKPDEIYGMIERLSPGTRKIELFGRPHNVQPNW